MKDQQSASVCCSIANRASNYYQENVQRDAPQRCKTPVAYARRVAHTSSAPVTRAHWMNTLGQSFDLAERMEGYMACRINQCKKFDLPLHLEPGYCIFRAANNSTR